METVNVPVPLPREILDLLGTAEAQAEQAIREFVVLGLFQDARISGGKAAEILGLTKWGFTSLLVRRGIPYLQLGPRDLEEEFSAAESESGP